MNARWWGALAVPVLGAACASFGTTGGETTATDAGIDATSPREASTVGVIPCLPQRLDGGVLSADGCHLYALVTQQDDITYEEAKAAAASLGGHLATITSDADTAILEGFFQRNNTAGSTEYWLGGEQKQNQASPDAGWTWITGEPWSYTDWGANQPDDNGDGKENNEENFLCVDGNGVWHDTENDAKITGYFVETED